MTRLRAPGAARVLAALLLLAPPAAALDVQVEVGLDGLLVDGGWTPVEVRCALEADEPPLEGRVVVARPRELVASVEAPLRLQPGQATVTRLAVPSASGAAYEVRVVDAAGRTLARATPAGAPSVLLPDERLLVFVGPVGLPGLDEGGADRPRVARLSPERLPRDALALEPAAAIVLKPAATADTAHLELARDPVAAAALERYVRGGGTLVLVPGDAAFWQGGPLDELAPARVDGRGEERPGPALDAALGPLAGLEALPVIACTPRAGARVTLAGERHPLVVERPLGRGRVVLVAFDPDRIAVRGAPRTASFVLGLVGVAPPRAPGLDGGDALALLHDVLAATPPLAAGWFYALVAAAVAQLLAVSLLTAALARRRGPWAGLVVPPLASALLGGLLLVAGALARGGPRVTTLVLEVPEPGGGAATLHAAVGIAAGRADRYALELPPALRPAAQPVPGFDLLRPRAARAALTLRPGKPALVGPIEARAHGRHLLLLTGRALRDDEGGAAGPALAARALPVLVTAAVGGEVRARVEVTSLEAQVVDGAQVLVFGPTGTRVGPLGPLAPGDSTTFAPGLPAAVGREPSPLDAAAVTDDAALARAVLERVVVRLEAAWLRAAASAPGAAQPPPPGWVLHARVERGSVVRVLDATGEPLDDARGRTIRVTCVQAEGGW